MTKKFLSENKELMKEWDYEKNENTLFDFLGDRHNAINNNIR